MVIRSSATWTDADPSTTLVASLNPVNRPQNRDSAMPCRPRSSTSCGSAGASTGMPSSAIATSELLGTVEDLATESSPTMTSTPPPGSAPPRLPCRSASVARSRPGALPYQIPTTPSQVLSAEAEASWEPWTALAPSSSLTEGRWTTPCASSSVRRRPISRS